MKIREYGEVILCRNIVFEDGKYDVEKGHPGIVLLPTSEKDDNAFCLYMTTDKKRAKCEEDKYIKYTGKAVQGSYINLQHIIKTVNTKEGEISKLENEIFIELLENFYKFQNSLENPKKEFLAIKGKIEVLLDLLKIANESDIEDIITAELLESLANITDIKQRRRLYGPSLLLLQDGDKKSTKKEFLKSEKERKYTERLIEIYNKLRNIDFDKLDYDDPNNELRAIYLDFRNKNYLINADMFFFDILALCDSDMSHKIKKFIKLEKEREQKRQQLEKIRRTQRRKSRKNSKIQEIENIRNEKVKRRKEKYGESEYFEY